MANNLLRTIWILPNVLMYCTAIGLLIFLAVFAEAMDAPTVFIYSGFVVLTLFVAVFGTYKILQWIKEGKM